MQTTIRENPQRNNRELNKLSSEDRAAHDWYRFVLSFPPHLVRDYLRKFKITPNQRVLDPFCGTGTTVVECKKCGIPSVGIEAHTFAHFVGTVKCDWSPDPAALLQASQHIAEQVLAELASQGIDDDPFFRDWQQGVRVPSVALRGLAPELEDLLLTNSISPLPLHKVLVLRDCLKRHAAEPHYQHQLLALAKAMTFSIRALC